MNRRIALILVLTGVLVVLQASHVRELLAGRSALPLPVDVADGALVVAPLTRGASSAALAAAGLRAGDRIVAASAGDGTGGEVRGLATLLDARRRAMAHPPLRLTVQRRAAGATRLVIDAPAGPGPPARFLALNLAWTILLPVAALVAALLLGLLKAEDHRAFIGSLLFITFAGAFSLDPYSLGAGARELAVVARITCLFGVDVLFLWFFLVFPTPSLIERRLPWLKHLALAVMSLGAAVALARQGALLSSLELYQQLRVWLPEPLFGRVFDVAGFTFIVIGVTSLTLNTLRPQSRDDRWRMVIILFGTLVSLVPFITLAAYLSLYERRPPLWMAIVMGTLIAFFPLSFVYAVVRHRVLGIRLILRRGAQYALISAGFRALLAALVFVLFWFVIGPLLAPLGQGPVTSGLLAAGAAIAAARLLRNLRGRIMPAIDRRFFRDAYDARRVLTDLSRSVRELALEPDRLLTRFVDTLSVTLHPRTTAVFMPTLDAETGLGAGPFRCVALRCDEGRALDPATLELPAGGVVIARVGPPSDETPIGPVDLFLDEPRSWAHSLVTDRAHAGERAALAALGVQLVIPLAAGPRLLGVVVLGEKRSEEPYSRDDKELLATVAEQTALALDYGQLARRAAREEVFRKEIEIARNVQTRLFPQFLPPVPALDYAGVCRPAREVGGDSYDFIALEHGRLGLALGDISGKGVSAALLMASLQALLRSHAPLPGRELKELVADINRVLVASIPDNRFATFFYGVFDSTQRTLTYVNAGHNPPLLLRAGQPSAERLDPTGMMLGILADAVFEQATVTLSPGDVLVIFSDGVSDALDADGGEYGDRRLEAFVRAHAALPAAGLTERILDDVASFGGGVPAFDDMTLVVAKLVVPGS